MPGENNISSLLRYICNMKKIQIYIQVKIYSSRILDKPRPIMHSTNAFDVALCLLYPCRHSSQSYLVLAEAAPGMSCSWTIHILLLSETLQLHMLAQRKGVILALEMNGKNRRNCSSHCDWLWFFLSFYNPDILLCELTQTKHPSLAPIPPPPTRSPHLPTVLNNRAFGKALPFGI